MTRPQHPTLGPALKHLRSRPPRAWSLIVTFYGDAVVPRGGSLWLGTLIELMEELDFGSGLVRTAMSRLAADGWLERARVGRNSFYRLTPKGRETFDAAAQHIYNPHPPAWDGRFSLIVPGERTDREAARARLQAAGYGSAAPGLWIAPLAAHHLQDVDDGAFGLEARLSRGEAAQLAALAWPLGRMALSYHHFLEDFAPLNEALRGGETLAPLDAIKARLLLIHEYRRIILRDPMLPAELLPPDWPGGRARDLCRAVYPKLVEASERWLDEHGRSESGPLPLAGAGLHARFA